MSNPNLDNVLCLLSDSRRRQSIQILRQSPDEVLELEELLDELTRSAAEDPKRRDHLAIQLHHLHLPKLACEDLIVYDRDDRQIRYRPNQIVESVLDAISQKQSRAVSND